MEEMLRIQDVMKELNISQRRVERLIAGGLLESSKVGGVHRISLDALERYLRHEEQVKQGKLKPMMGKDLFGNDFDYSIWAKKKPKRNGKRIDDVNWVDIRDVWDDPGISSLTAVDLFSGAGGITKGFEMAGLQNVCGLDWFDEAAKTYERNFNHPFINGDIKSPENKELFYVTVKKELKGRKLNIVAGGFPCQGFSLSGNRVVDDPRNSLYKEMLEIVNEFEPDYVLMENVKGLRSMLDGKVEEMIIKDYEAAGYEVNVTVLNSANYSVPQKRERIIFICNRIGRKNLHPMAFLREFEYVTVGDAISDLMDLPDDKSFNHVRSRHNDDFKKRLSSVPEGQSLYGGYSDAFKKSPWDKPSCTIKENHGGVNIHPHRPRVITAREMARLQSFPDDFIFEGSKSKQLIQLGNAVPPLLAKAIGLAIRKSAGEL